MDVDYRFDPRNTDWDFLVVSRFAADDSKGRSGIATATVHKGEGSRDVEVEAAKACGYDTTVYDLRGKERHERERIKREAGL